MLILKNCTKSFKKTKALNDFSCEFKHGIYGLLGPNGSGKTTMMRCICGLLSPEKGSIECDCENIGYLPQQFGAMKSLTVYETMRYFATLKKIPKSNQDNEIRYCIDLVNLSDKIKNKVGSLSGGMVRRLGIAQAIMGNPEIVLFDEPTAGLDPRGRDEILGLISSLHEGTGMTVILVSHSMEDVANYVERIIVMNKGSVAYDDVPRNVFRHYMELEQIGLAAPQVTYVMQELRAAGFPVSVDATTVNEARDEILKVFQI